MYIYDVIYDSIASMQTSECGTCNPPPPLKKPYPGVYGPFVKFYG